MWERVSCRTICTFFQEDGLESWADALWASQSETTWYINDHASSPLVKHSRARRDYVATTIVATDENFPSARARFIIRAAGRAMATSVLGRD
jgi:hypothetical protein